MPYRIKVFFLLLFLSAIVFSCKSDDDYEEGPLDDDQQLESPVNFDINEVPYQVLSEYNFYLGNMEDLIPVYGVLPYNLITPLFTDYAKKSRFIWMPKGVSASFVNAESIFDFPTGTVLIKNFYYDNVLPGNSRKIIETRLMIKKPNEWIFANYIWNEAQTEATLDLTGGFVSLEWMQNGTPMSNVYRIPSENECLMCHKFYGNPIPVGPKPQNINSVYNYADGAKNQMDKWFDMGYLDSGYSLQINTVSDWTDATQGLDKRIRSYLDSNCAHCHSEGGHCDYRSLDLSYYLSDSEQNLGICETPQEDISDWVGYVPSHIVKPQDITNSTMYLRLNTNEESIKMPMVGRNMIHTEFVDLLETWINTLTADCE